MLERILAYVQANPGATNFRVAEAFGLSRGMADRFLELLEDRGQFYLDRPAEVCTGCGPKKPDAATACSASGPASRLNALADAARARKGTS